MYRLVNLMLWLNLQNIPDAEEEIPELGYNPFPLMVWIFSLGLLVLLDAFYLIESIVHNFEFREAENRKAGWNLGRSRNLYGRPSGDRCDDTPGAEVPRLQGQILGVSDPCRRTWSSSWRTSCRVYGYGQPSLSGYSKINEGESQV
jgi:hypothetical protein